MATRRKKNEDVELNLAAMLDMAFQLLTFFILTFKPAPVEGQIELKMPPAQPVAVLPGNPPPGDRLLDRPEFKDMKTLTINVRPTADGQIARLAIGDGDSKSLPQLDAELKTVFADSDNGFDQVVIQAGTELQYQQLMKVVDVCSRQTLADGRPLTRLSFAELPFEGTNVARRRRRKKNEDVELNLAAMLDMAFQLLTFFILTFKPAPVEGQIELKMPPPQPVTVQSDKTPPPGSNDNSDATAGLNSLVISIFPTPGGQIAQLAIGENNIGPSPQQLEGQLKTVLSDPSNPFDQVIIQVGSTLHYDNLMKIIDVCTRQTLPDGKKLTRLSFVELPMNQ